MNENESEQQQDIFFLRLTLETEAILDKAKALTGIDNPALLFQAAEDVCFKNLEKITPALFKIDIPPAEEVKTAAIRFRIPDQKAHQAIVDTIKQRWSIKKVWARHLFKIVMLTYIQALEGEYTETETENIPANTTDSSAKSKDNDLKEAQLAAIDLIIRETDADHIRDLIAYYNYKWQNK